MEMSRACVKAPIKLTPTKVPVNFDGLLDGNNGNSETLTWRYTLTRAPTADSAADAIAALVDLNDYLVYNYTTFSGGLREVTHTAQVVSCAGLCPAAWSPSSLPFPLVDAQGSGNLNGTNPVNILTAYPFGLGNTQVSMLPGDTLTFDIDFGYANFNGMNCVESSASLTNYWYGAPLGIPSGYDAWDPSGVGQAQPTATIDSHKPRCVDVAINKSISPANPSVGTPITFNLDVQNITLSTTTVARTATNVVVTDVLGSQFTATAASCVPLSGTSTVPVGSLLGSITGASNTFNVTIPSIDDGASVRCMITGTVSTPNSYNNVATVNATTGALKTDLFDALAGNNSSTLTYGIAAPATVRLTKALSGAVAGYVAGGTFPATVACVITQIPGAATSNTSSTVNLTPGTPLDVVVPSATATQSVTCTVSEGALPAAAAGYQYGTPTISTVTVTDPAPGAIVSSTITNPLITLSGSLTITKTISGAPVGYVPATGFNVFATCNLPAAGTRYPASGFVSATTTTPAIIGNIPAGASCIIDEDVASLPAAAANYTWSIPSITIVAGATIPAGGTLGGYSVENSMFPNPAGLTVTKTIAGAAASVITSALSFPFTVACSTPTANYIGTVPVAANTLLGNSAAISIPAGSTSCTITEGTLPGAPAGYRWAAAVNYTQPAAGAVAAGGSISGSMGNTLQSGSLVINKIVTIALPVAATFNFTLNCVAPSTTPATTALGVGVSTSQSIALAAGATAGSTAAIGPIAAGSTCSVTEAAPAAIPNYKWGTTPAATTGLVIANSATPTAVPVTNVLTPLDPPFISKRSRLIDATTIEWTITVVNNSINNAGLTAIAINVTDAIPGNATIVAGSVACTPTGTPGQTAVTTCGFNPGNTNLSVTGTLAYTNTPNANAATAPERIDIVFRGTVGPGQTVVNIACADLQNVADTPVCAQNIINTAALPVPTLDTRALAALMLLMLLAAAGLRGQQRRRG